MKRCHIFRLQIMILCFDHLHNFTGQVRVRLQHEGFRMTVHKKRVSCMGPFYFLFFIKIYCYNGLIVIHSLYKMQVSTYYGLKDTAT